MSNKQMVAMISFVLLCVTMFVGCSTVKAKDVTYPKGLSSDNRDERKALWEKYPLNEEFGQRLNEFSYDLSAELFKLVPADVSYEENLVFSPLSLYYGMAMAYAGSNGETREELSRLLYMDEVDLDAFYKANKALYNRIYKDDDLTKLKIANSIWVDKRMTLKKGYTSEVNDCLYASVHAVDFLDDKTSEDIGDWLNKETDGF